MASSIATSAARQLGGLLVEEAKYLYAVSDKIERLQNELEWMECFLEDADNRQHRERVVRKWIAEISEFSYEAEDIIVRYLHKVSHHRQNGVRNTIKWFSCCIFDVVNLHEVGSRIDDLRSGISELISRMQTYGIQIIRQPESSIYNTSVREQRRTYPHTEDDPVGLEKHIDKVVDQLFKNDVVKVVGISGMGGLGKTTLARRVFSCSAIKQHFKNNCVWVYISKEFEKRSIFEEILIGLRAAKDGDGRKRIRELTDEELPRNICEVLKEKECFVVLDDIWEAQAWNTLKPAFESIKYSHSKILITTRNEGLLQEVHPSGYTHPFGFLSEEDSWRLLERKAFSEGDSSVVEQKAEMETLAKEMLKHCKGLPLAIVALGGMLAMRKNVNDWRTIKQHITSYLTSDMGGISGNDQVLPQVMPVLELSYYDLPFYLKPCFLYLANFPEDFEIPAQRLYHLWEAEGLVTVPTDDEDDIQRVRLDDIAESYLSQLVKRCMVQVEKRWANGSIKTCRLHDIMRDMCIKKCKEVNFLRIIEQQSTKDPANYSVSSSLTNRKLHRCAVYLGENFDHLCFGPYLSKAPCTRSLLVFPQGLPSLKKLVSPNIWKSISLLRVLDLQEIELRDGFKIGDLIHLRYLSLRHAFFYGLLSGFWDCKYLETLDLRCWRISKLDNKFCKLKRLRHLYLPHEMELRGSGKLILSDDQLQQMETLKNFHKEKCRIEDLIKMANLRIFSFAKSCLLNREGWELLLKSPMIATESLVNPLRLCIEANIINEEPTVLTTMKSHACIREITISGRMEVTFKYGDVQIFPHNLNRVFLLGCEIGKEGILELEKLPHLKHLQLSGKAFGGNKMIFSDGGFPELDRLELFWLKELEEWEVGKEALPNLRHLFINWCKRLKKIPDGLPSSVEIRCYKPCINGIENYNTCPDFKRQAAG